MFERFGEFDSWQDLNRAAEGQKTQGDTRALADLAEENGIDMDDVEDYVNDQMESLCTPFTAAMGKLDIEEKDLKPSEIVKDWINYIRSAAADDVEMQKAIRKKGKSLIGCIASILKWSYKARYKVDERIVKESGISARVSVEAGIPGMASAKKIIRNYYLGG